MGATNWVRGFKENYSNRLEYKIEIKRIQRKLPVTVEITSSGYSAYAGEDTVYTTAPDLDQLKRNLVNAYNLALEEEGRYVTLQNLTLKMDFAQFFQYYRLFNADMLAKRIGIHPTLLSQYVNGIKTLSEKQKQRVLEGIRGIGEELSRLEFL